MIGKKFRGYCHEFGSFVYGRLLRRDYYNTGYYECCATCSVVKSYCA